MKKEIIFTCNGLIETAFIIPDYPGYSVTEHGVIYTHKKTRPSHDKSTRIVTINYNNGKERKTIINSKGYKVIMLSNNGINKTYAIHRIVCEVFYGKCPVGYEVRHLDGDKMNCHYTNLKYGTPRENRNDRKKHGTHQEGQYAPNSKLTQSEADSIRVIRQKGMKIKEICSLFKVSRSVIYDILKNKSYKSDNNKLLLRPAKRKVKITTIETNEIIMFDSVLSASRTLKIPYCRISSAIQGFSNPKDGRLYEEVYDYKLCDKQGNSI